jgi:hypothetical protein
MAKYTMKDGALRLYDSTATPFYLVLKFIQGDFTAPAGRARPEERLVLDRGILNTDGHYVDGPDDPILEPVQITFSLLLDESANKTKLRQAINADSADTTSGWTVGGDTWLTTKIDGTLISGSGASVAPPAFADDRKGTVDIEVLWNDPDGVGAVGMQYKGCYFSPEQQSLAEGEDGIPISLTAMCYGPIAEISAFTAGTES